MPGRVKKRTSENKVYKEIWFTFPVVSYSILIKDVILCPTALTIGKNNCADASKRGNVLKVINRKEAAH